MDSQHAESSTNAQAGSKNSEDLVDEESEMSQNERQGHIEQILAIIDNNMPPESTLAAALAQQQQQQPQIPPRNPLENAPNGPLPLTPPQIQQEVQQLEQMQYAPRMQRLVQLQQQQPRQVMNAITQHFTQQLLTRKRDASPRL